MILPIANKRILYDLPGCNATWDVTFRGGGERLKHMTEVHELPVFWSNNFWKKVPTLNPSQARTSMSPVLYDQDWMEIYEQTFAAAALSTVLAGQNMSSATIAAKNPVVVRSLDDMMRSDFTMPGSRARMIITQHKGMKVRVDGSGAVVGSQRKGAS
ncbi:unnamed protein product [Sympodiomycopsis kandeliae]